MKQRINFLVLNFIIIVLVSGLWAQSHEISFNARIDRTTVPQNQTVDFHIMLEWTGPADLFEVEEVTQPSLNNLNVVGSGSHNQVMVEQGIPKTKKTYTFSLQPDALGMAYVEPINIRYFCRADSQSTTLQTQRLEIKVTDPVFEDEDGGLAFLITIISGLVILAFVIFGVIWWQQKRHRELLAEMNQNAVKTPEEQILESLTASVDISDPEQMDQKWQILSRAVRRYLSECRHVNATHLPTRELSDELPRLAFNEKETDLFVNILTAGDEVKFARKELPLEHFEKYYSDFIQLLKLQTVKNNEKKS